MRPITRFAILSLLVVACTDQPLQDPTAPTVPAGPAARADLTLNPTAQIRVQILNLFPLGGGLLIAQASFEVIVLKLQAGKTAQAQALAQALINFTTSKYAAGVLFGGKSPGTLKKVGALVSALEAYVGLVQAIPQGATDTALAVVVPSTNFSDTTKLVTPSGQAGAAVPGTAVTVPTLVTIYAVPDTTDTLLTNLPKYRPYYQVTSSTGSFNNAVLTGICTDAPATISNLRLAHNVPDPGPDSIQILPLASTQGLLTCNPYPVALGPSQNSGSFAVRGLRALGNEIARLLSPELLSAGTSGTGVGGTTKNFSTFGVVQTGFDWSATGWSYRPLGTYASFPTAGAIDSAVNSNVGYSGPAHAAFSDSSSYSGCSIYNSTTINNTTAYPLNSVVAFRRTFVPPNGSTIDTMYFAVDNDFKVFVNDTDRTANVVHSPTDQGYTSGIGAFESGFISHDGCANRGDWTLPLTGLSTVGNTVVIVAVDRGGASYFDASLTP